MLAFWRFRVGKSRASRPSAHRNAATDRHEVAECGGPGRPKETRPAGRRLHIREADGQECAHRDPERPAWLRRSDRREPRQDRLGSPAHKLLLTPNKHPLWSHKLGSKAL